MDPVEKIRQRIQRRNSRKINRVRLNSKSMLLTDDRTPTTTISPTKRSTNFVRPRSLFPRSDKRPFVRELPPCRECHEDILKFLDSHGWVSELIGRFFQKDSFHSCVEVLKHARRSNHYGDFENIAPKILHWFGWVRLGPSTTNCLSRYYRKFSRSKTTIGFRFKAVRIFNLNTLI